MGACSWIIISISFEAKQLASHAFAKDRQPRKESLTPKILPTPPRGLRDRRTEKRVSLPPPERDTSVPPIFGGKAILIHFTMAVY
jgi:hypothetical protein